MSNTMLIRVFKQSEVPQTKTKKYAICYMIINNFWKWWWMHNKEFIRVGVILLGCACCNYLFYCNNVGGEEKK